MEFAPSETVVLHPLRFVDPGGAAALAPRATVARMATIAAVVACASRGSVELEGRAIPILALIPGAGRRLRARPGRGSVGWPSGSLEEALQRVVAASAVGVDLDEALRNVLVTGGRLVPDAIGFVEAGLRSRGIDRSEAVDRTNAGEVQQLLADQREHDPERWMAIAREVDRALRAPLLRHAMQAARGRVPDPPLRRRTRDFLESWRRLNRDPPSAR